MSLSGLPTRAIAPPLSPSAETAALADGRPAATRAILRGVCRAFVARDFAVLTEFTLASGQRADVLALGPAGELVIVEVKSSLADYRADQKWDGYLAWCERFFFAVDAQFPQAILPVGAGLIVADAYDAAILREPEAVPLAPARRKAVTLRFARQAAARVQRLLDPGVLSG